MVKKNFFTIPQGAGSAAVFSTTFLWLETLIPVTNAIGAAFTVAWNVAVQVSLRAQSCNEDYSKIWESSVFQSCSILDSCRSYFWDKQHITWQSKASQLGVSCLILDPGLVQWTIYTRLVNLLQIALWLTCQWLTDNESIKLFMLYNQILRLKTVLQGWEKMTQSRQQSCRSLK